MNGISAFIKEALPPPLCENTGRSQESATPPKHAGILILDVWSKICGKFISGVYKPPICGILLQQPEQTKTLPWYYTHLPHWNAGLKTVRIRSFRSSTTKNEKDPGM